jgi:ApaG protein
MKKKPILTPYQSGNNGIVVTVLPAFLAHESDLAAHKFVWGYAIRIRNMTDQSVQLTERHWIIFDALGRKEEVRGEGVVGEQPIIKPGSYFDYNSGVPLTTPSGMMRGRYRFTTAQGEPFWVDIPAFSLDSEHETRNHH